MSQLTNWTIPNSGGSAFRVAINAALAALQSNSSGPAAPSPTVAGMTWFDTTNLILKRRNNANTAWIDVSLDTIGANTLRGNPTGSAAAETAVSMTQLKTMLGYAQNLTVGGYQILPSGLILQFGVTGAIAAGGGNVLTWPVAFPNAVFASYATARPTANNTLAYSVGTRGETLTTVVVTNNHPSNSVPAASYFALGN